MDVMAEFTLDAVGPEEHLSEHIARIAGILEDEGLEHEVGPAGTTIVGPLPEVLDAIARCHERLGAKGARIKSTVTLDARQDWPPGAIELQAEKVRKASPTA